VSTAKARAPAAGMLDTHEALGDAIAIIDPRADLVLETTTQWCKRVPAPSELLTWSSLLAREPSLTGLLERSSSEPRRIELTTGSVQARVSVLDGQRVVVRLSDEAGAAESMRDYMVSREFLFSRSRTISIAEMATTLAHEINQPIGTITNMLAGVRRRLGQPGVSLDAMQRALDKALEQARFTANVVARIRGFTEARRPRRDVLDISTVVRDAIELLDWLFKAHDCRVSTRFPRKTLWVVGDETLLQQVAINLLRNGVDAMSETPASERRLDVRVLARGDDVEFQVHDNGAGLADEGRSLFVAFASSKPDGMGVGLNICRSFVELHQGRIWLSPGEQGGCAAHVSLPCVAAPVPAETSAGAAT